MATAVSTPFTASRSFIRRDPAIVQWLLTGLAFLVLGVFIVLPLAAVFISLSRRAGTHTLLRFR